MNNLEKDLDMEPYFRAWDAQKKAVESLPDMESGIGRALKHGGHRPFRKLLRREVACLIAGIVLFVFFLCHYQKGMAMPIPYIITLLLCVLCMADSLYALRLIALTNLLTASIPDMLINCARLRLYQKIELLAALGVVLPLTFLFIAPVTEWILYSVNLYIERINDIAFWIILLTTGVSGVLASIYLYCSNIRFIKDSIKEIRENRDFFKK